MSEILYEYDPAEDSSVVHSVLFQSMRFLDETDICDRLRYTNLTLERIEAALFKLVSNGYAERHTTYRGVDIYRWRPVSRKEK